MKKYFLLLLMTPLFFVACDKSEDLPPTEYVMIKFENKTGKNLENLSISRASIGELGRGKKSDYVQYDALGQQYGYALVEAVADIEGTRFYTASACRGECGTPSAPDGVWLEAGYHKIAIRISDELGGNYMEFIMMD
ncbi:MAG: hypothetical protein AAFZ15_21230 [Bacteroidota bacterium]